MIRALPLLLAASALLAQEKDDVLTLLLKGGTSTTGRLVRVERDGVRLRHEAGGQELERVWTWEQIDDADPLKPTRPHADGYVAGVEVEQAGLRVRGVVVSRSADLLVVRNREGLWRFDPSRVRLAEVWIPDRDVLCDEELRARLAPGEAPATPADHRRAAAEASRLGQDERANDLLLVAEVLSELGRPDREVFRRIGALPTDTAARSRAAWALRRRVLDQAYEEAIAELDRWEAADVVPGAAEVREELERLRALRVEARIPLYIEAAAAETLWDLARDAGLSWEAASIEVRQRLSEDLTRRAAARFGVDAETARKAWEGRLEDRPLVACWGAASLLAGNASAAEREAWWSAASPEERYAALRSLHAEVSGRVTDVVEKGCPGCGGRGEKDGLPCPRCGGNRIERVVLHR